MLQAIPEGLDLDLSLIQLATKVVDRGAGGLAIDGLDDLLSLAIKRLSRPIPVPGHRGHLAISTVEDRKTTGDELGDRGHEASPVKIDRKITLTIAHPWTGIVHQQTSSRGWFKKVPRLITLSTPKGPRQSNLPQLCKAGPMP